MDNFYVNNILDKRNIVFECTDFDVSSNIAFNLNYIDYNRIPKFQGISTSAIIDISSSVLDNLFMFQDNINGEFIYGINPNITLNIEFSKAKIIINNTITNNTIIQDYIKHIVTTLFGIITEKPEQFIDNIPSISQSIKNNNVIFNTKLNSIITKYGDASLNDTIPTLNIYKSEITLNNLEKQCRSLITGILNIDSTYIQRQNQFLVDLKNQSPPYYFKFNTNDQLVLRIDYNTYYLLDSKEYNLSRSYKIILNILD
jgi:hypothetical protein